MKAGLITLPDKNLRYISHETEGNMITIYVKSLRTEAVCPYCGTLSNKIHSQYKRIIHDLPIQGMKTRLSMLLHKFFCQNTECEKKTFAETFTFYKGKATRTNRVQDEIFRVALTQSSISASKYLSGSVVAIGKSSICEMLKKR